jgi:signal transduction histidine kinase
MRTRWRACRSSGSSETEAARWSPSAAWAGQGPQAAGEAQAFARPRRSTQVAHGGTVLQRPRADTGGLTNTDESPPAAQPTRRSILAGRSVRYAARMVLIAVGYYVAAQSGETLLLTGGVGAFWPATGVGIALLYLGELRWWPGVLLGDLVGTLIDFPGARQPLGIALADTAGHVARAVVAVVLLHRLVGRRAAMDRLEQVGAVFVAVAVGEALAATVAILARWAEAVLVVSEVGVFWWSWWLGGVAGGLVVLPLALAWAHPRASVWRGRRAVEGALMLAAVAGLSVIALSTDQPLTYMVFPAFIWAALRFGPQGATLAVTIAAVVAVLVTSHEQGAFVELSPTESALNLQLYITFAALTTFCLAAIVSERRRDALELAESQRREAERAALERQRIARDLHDSVSQSLFSTTLHVRTAQHALAREGLDATGWVGEELSEIGQLTRGALAEMRALIFELRPGALAEEGLVAALTKQAAALSAREGVVFEVDGPRERLPLAPEVEEQLYRLAQEALANVVKHARASSATVRITAEDDTVSMGLSDDGRGFDPAAVGPQHFGLRSMQGRVADLGGKFEVTSALGRGTVLRVELPIQH